MFITLPLLFVVTILAMVGTVTWWPAWTIVLLIHLAFIAMFHWVDK